MKRRGLVKSEYYDWPGAGELGDTLVTLGEKMATDYPGIPEVAHNVGVAAW